MNFQEQLKQLRKENRMSQNDLAKMLGMAKGTVSMWEMGQRNPSFDALERMSEIFDKRVDYILGNSEDASSPKITEAEMEQLGRWRVEDDFFYDIIMKYLRLDNRGKTAVEALINAEYSVCRSDDTLFPRDDFLLSVKVKV